ncbi:hypothetical protein Tco_0566726 [Tanacetum coccineum]
MTREMVESFCNSYYIPDEVHPTASWRDRNITQFPEGKVGVYTRLFDYCGYRIPFTKFFVAILKHFRIHISQLSPFGAARVSHFEVLTRVLDLASSVAVFRAFYTRIYSDELFSFAKRSLSSPSYLSKPPDSIKNWADHFFWVDSKVFPISVPLYMGGLLEKDPAPHLTARQEQVVQVFFANKAPFRRYPECFLVLVGLCPYYPFDENTYPAFERPDKTDMGLLDYIRTADPRKVQAVEVQKGEEQKWCSGSGAGPEVSALSAEENIVAEENIIPVGTYLDLIDPEDDLIMAEKGDAARKQPEKAKRKKLLKQSDTLPAKRLRADVHTQVTVRNSRVADAPVYTTADTVTSSRGKTLAAPTSDVGGSSQPETSEGEKDVEIARLKSLVEEKETESAEVPRLRDQVSVLTAEKSFLSAEVSALKSAVSQKDTDISLLDSRATEMDFCSEVSTLHSAFRDFKEKMEAQQEAQAQVLYNRVCWPIEAPCDGVLACYGEMFEVPGKLQGILGHCFRRCVDFGMQERLAAVHEHGVAGTPLSVVTTYNPGTVEANYLDAVRALEEAEFPLVHLLKSIKDSGMDEVLDCFLLDGPLADLPEAAHLQPCFEQLSVPIYHADVKAVVGETSLSFALLNVHTRAEGAKKHAAALRQLMVDIVSRPLSSQNLLGEASTSAAALSV